MRLTLDGDHENIRETERALQHAQAQVRPRATLTKHIKDGGLYSLGTSRRAETRINAAGIVLSMKSRLDLELRFLKCKASIDTNLGAELVVSCCGSYSDT